MEYKSSKEEVDSAKDFLMNAFQRDGLTRNSYGNVVLFVCVHSEANSYSTRNVYSVYVIDKCQPINISTSVAFVLGHKSYQRNSIKMIEIDSGGEDTVAVMTTELSSALFAKMDKLDYRRLS